MPKRHYPECEPEEEAEEEVGNVGVGVVEEIKEE